MILSWNSPLEGLDVFTRIKSTLLFFFADINERIDTVRTKVWIDSSKILIKSSVFLTSYLNFAKVS